MKDCREREVAGGQCGSEGLKQSFSYMSDIKASM